MPCCSVDDLDVDDPDKVKEIGKKRLEEIRPLVRAE
jgi:hypothetical protein